MTAELPLATEFPPATQAEWRTLVDAALKGVPFDKKLVTQTYDGIRVEPLYPRAAGMTPVAGRTPGTPWTVMARVDHPDPAEANKQALDDLMNGATGLTLIFAGSLNANGYGLDSSPAVIERLFKDQLGTSPQRYYMDLRITEARRLLQHTSLTIVEVSVACGFVSPSHFSKCYSAYFGHRPSKEIRLAF